MVKHFSDKLFYLSYAWRFIVNIIILWLVISIFNNIYTNFETIIVSLLIFIYLGLSSFLSLWGNAKSEEILQSYNEFKKLRILLKEEVNEDEEMAEQQDLEQSKIYFKRCKIQGYINEIFRFIIFVIVLIKLVNILL